MVMALAWLACSGEGAVEAETEVTAEATNEIDAEVVAEATNEIDAEVVAAGRQVVELSAATGEKLPMLEPG